MVADAVLEKEYVNFNFPLEMQHANFYSERTNKSIKCLVKLSRGVKQ